MSEPLTILVTGSNGQLGKSLRKAAETSNDSYIFTDIEDLDITNRRLLNDFIENNKIDIAVNCAAYTNVDAAEDNYDAAELLNSTAVGYLSEILKSKDKTLIHISTDYVFGGSSGNTPIKETESVNPTGVYGLTKHHGEEMIHNSGVKAIIIRTSWLYSEFGKNFVKTMLNLTSSKPEIKVVFDQCGTPTYAQDLADAIVFLISQRKFSGNEGIYHYSNEGVCSWFDFANMISQFSDNHNCIIKPCHSDEFPSKVVRPSYSVLDKTKFKETFNITIPYWTDSLKKCLSCL